MQRNTSEKQKDDVENCLIIGSCLCLSSSKPKELACILWILSLSCVKGMFSLFKFMIYSLSLMLCFLAYRNYLKFRVLNTKVVFVEQGRMVVQDRNEWTAIVHKCITVMQCEWPQ